MYLLVTHYAIATLLTGQGYKNGQGQRVLEKEKTNIMMYQYEYVIQWHQADHLAGCVSKCVSNVL
jgi:hypothetical protein